MTPKLRLRACVAVIVAGSGLVGPRAALAHHTLEALYDTSREVTSTATLLKLDWINPHAWLHVDIEAAEGRTDKNVLMETVGLASLRQLGFSRETVNVGRQYVLTYYPNRDGSPGGFVTTIVLPTGGVVGPPTYDPRDPGEAECGECS
jgi:hypothetical protein